MLPSNLIAAMRTSAAQAKTKPVPTKYQMIRSTASGARKVQASQIAARKNSATPYQRRAATLRSRGTMPVASGGALSQRRTDRRRCTTMVAKQIINTRPTAFCNASCAEGDRPSSNATSPMA